MSFEKNNETQSQEQSQQINTEGSMSMMPPVLQLQASKATQASEDDTPVWSTTNNWSDQIEKKDHKIRLGKDFKEGMTYTDAWKIMAPQLQEKYLKENQKFDCADFSMHIMVEFAYMFGLPVRFDDYKAESDPSFNNDAGGFQHPSKGWIDIETGDWERFADNMKVHYGAADLYNNRNVTQEKENFRFNEGDNLNPGDLIGYKYDSGAFHSQTVSEVKDSWWWDFDDDVDYFSTIQGSLENGDDPTPLNKKEYGFGGYDYNEENDKIRRGNADVRVMEWNFGEFDKKR